MTLRLLGSAVSIVLDFYIAVTSCLGGLVGHCWRLAIFPEAEPLSVTVRRRLDIMFRTSIRV